MTKCAASFAGLSLPLPALTGYDATPGAENGASALLWLSVLYAIVPTVLFLLAPILLTLATHRGAAPALPGAHRPPRCPGRESRPT